MEITSRKSNSVPAYIVHWEAYDRLYYTGQFDALIKLQAAYVKRNPENHREKLLLSDAYNYAGKHRKALKILTKLHKNNPYDTEYVTALAECLVKLKINPNMYPWRRNVLIFDSIKKYNSHNARISEKGYKVKDRVE